MLAGYADSDSSYPHADPDMLLNLNTGYADTDADLCIKIMSLCCINTISIQISFINLLNFMSSFFKNPNQVEKEAFSLCISCQNVCLIV